MNDVLWISLGAVVGANLRYAVSRLALQHLSPSVPYGTLLVNVTGSPILGFFLAWTTERVLAAPSLRLLVAVGFCGGYMTYSSYSYETVTLLEQGHYTLEAANFLANNIASLLSAVAGIALARAI